MRKWRWKTIWTWSTGSSTTDRRKRKRLRLPMLLSICPVPNTGTTLSDKQGGTAWLNLPTIMNPGATVCMTIPSRKRMSIRWDFILMTTRRTPPWNTTGRETGRSWRFPSVLRILTWALKRWSTAERTGRAWRSLFLIWKMRSPVIWMLLIPLPSMSSRDCLRKHLTPTVSIPGLRCMPLKPFWVKQKRSFRANWPGGLSNRIKPIGFIPDSKVT